MSETHIQDLADHIRTVHLTLLIVSLVLMTASGDSSATAKNAYNELAAIERLSDEHTKVEQFLRNNARVILLGALPGMETDSVLDQYFEKRKVLTLNISGSKAPSQIAVDTGPSSLYIDSRVHHQDGEVHIGGWSDLTEFIGFWNSLSGFTHNPLWRRGLRLNSSKTLTGCAADVSMLEASEASEGPVQNVIWGYDAGKRELSADISFPNSLVLRSGVKSCTLLTQQVPPLRDAKPWLGYFVHQSWRNGTFDDSFRALNDATQSEQNVPIPALLSHLGTRANRERERIDLLGLRIPAERFSYVSTLVLLACQFYFWAHLSSLSKLISKKGQWPTGYIGLYMHQRMTVHISAASALLPIFGASPKHVR